MQNQTTQQQPIIQVNKGNFLSMAKHVGIGFAKAWAESAGVTQAQIQLWLINSK